MASGVQKVPLLNSPSLRRGVSGNKSDSNKGSKYIQDSSGAYDSKLVEMINTAIVDKSPSVKWDDVGMILGSNFIFRFCLKVLIVFF